MELTYFQNGVNSAAAELGLDGAEELIEEYARGGGGVDHPEQLTEKSARTFVLDMVLPDDEWSRHYPIHDPYDFFLGPSPYMISEAVAAKETPAKDHAVETPAKERTPAKNEETLANPPPIPSPTVCGKVPGRSPAARVLLELEKAAAPVAEDRDTSSELSNELYNVSRPPTGATLSADDAREQALAALERGPSGTDVVRGSVPPREDKAATEGDVHALATWIRQVEEDIPALAREDNHVSSTVDGSSDVPTVDSGPPGPASRSMADAGEQAVVLMGNALLEAKAALAGVLADKVAQKQAISAAEGDKAAPGGDHVGGPLVGGGVEKEEVLPGAAALARENNKDATADGSVVATVNPTQEWRARTGSISFALNHPHPTSQKSFLDETHWDLTLKPATYVKALPHDFVSKIHYPLTANPGSYSDGRNDGQGQGDDRMKQALIQSDAAVSKSLAEIRVVLETALVALGRYAAGFRAAEEWLVGERRGRWLAGDADAGKTAGVAGGGKVNGGAEEIRSPGWRGFTTLPFKGTPAKQGRSGDQVSPEEGSSAESETIPNPQKDVVAVFQESLALHPDLDVLADGKKISFASELEAVLFLKHLTVEMRSLWANTLRRTIVDFEHPVTLEIESYIGQWHRQLLCIREWLGDELAWTKVDSPLPKVVDMGIGGFRVSSPVLGESPPSSTTIASKEGNLDHSCGRNFIVCACLLLVLHCFASSYYAAQSLFLVLLRRLTTRAVCSRDMMSMHRRYTIARHMYRFNLSHTILYSLGEFASNPTASADAERRTTYISVSSNASSVRYLTAPRRPAGTSVPLSPTEREAHTRNLRAHTYRIGRHLELWRTDLVHTDALLQQVKAVQGVVGAEEAEERAARAHRKFVDRERARKFLDKLKKEWEWFREFERAGEKLRLKLRDVCVAKSAVLGAVGEAGKRRELVWQARSLGGGLGVGSSWGRADSGGADDAESDSAGLEEGARAESSSASAEAETEVEKHVSAAAPFHPTVPALPSADRSVLVELSEWEVLRIYFGRQHGDLLSAGPGLSEERGPHQQETSFSGRDFNNEEPSFVQRLLAFIVDRAEFMPADDMTVSSVKLLRSGAVAATDQAIADTFRRHFPEPFAQVASVVAAGGDGNSFVGGRFELEEDASGSGGDDSSSNEGVDTTSSNEEAEGSSFEEDGEQDITLRRPLQWRGDQTISEAFVEGVEKLTLLSIGSGAAAALTEAVRDDFFDPLELDGNLFEAFFPVDSAQHFPSVRAKKRAKQQRAQLMKKTLPEQKPLALDAKDLQQLRHNKIQLRVRFERKIVVDVFGNNANVFSFYQAAATLSTLKVQLSDLEKRAAALEGASSGGSGGFRAKENEEVQDFTTTLGRPGGRRRTTPTAKAQSLLETFSERTRAGAVLLGMEFPGVQASIMWEIAEALDDHSGPDRFLQKFREVGILSSSRSSANGVVVNASGRRSVAVGVVEQTTGGSPEQATGGDFGVEERSRIAERLRAAAPLAKANEMWFAEGAAEVAPGRFLGKEEEDAEDGDGREQARARQEYWMLLTIMQRFSAGGEVDVVDAWLKQVEEFGTRTITPVDPATAAVLSAVPADDSGERRLVPTVVLPKKKAKKKKPPPAPAETKNFAGVSSEVNGAKKRPVLFLEADAELRDALARAHKLESAATQELVKSAERIATTVSELENQTKKREQATTNLIEKFRRDLETGLRKALPGDVAHAIVSSPPARLLFVGKKAKGKLLPAGTRTTAQDLKTLLNRASAQLRSVFRATLERTHFFQRSRSSTVDGVSTAQSPFMSVVANKKRKNSKEALSTPPSRSAEEVTGVDLIPLDWSASVQRHVLGLSGARKTFLQNVGVLADDDTSSTTASEKEFSPGGDIIREAGEDHVKQHPALAITASDSEQSVSSTDKNAAASMLGGLISDVLTLVKRFSQNNGSSLRRLLKDGEEAVDKKMGSFAVSSVPSKLLAECERGSEPSLPGTQQNEDVVAREKSALSEKKLLLRAVSTEFREISELFEAVVVGEGSVGQTLIRLMEEAKKLRDVSLKADDAIANSSGEDSTSLAVEANLRRYVADML